MSTSCTGKMWIFPGRWWLEEARFIFEDTVTVVHEEGGTQSKSRVSTKSPTYIYYNCRNRLVFAARNLTPEQQLHWKRLSYAYARQVLLSGGSRLALVSPKHVWAALSGTCAGLKHLRDARPGR